MPTQVRYAEWPAQRSPRAAVACAWVHRPAESAPGRVLPDACIDIIWDGAGLFVAGPDTGPVPIEPRPGVVYSGLRFRPGRAPGFLGTPAFALVDSRVDLAELWGQACADRIAARLSLAPTAKAAADILDTVVAQRAAAAMAPDPMIDGLVAFFQGAPQANGTVRAASQALGVLERSLYQHCTATVGYGPKTLERVIRFQRAMRLARRADSLADLAAWSGYADQAHLSRECRRLAGTTPSDLFKTASRAGS
jgi:AraC-like DNA-binding protein